MSSVYPPPFVGGAEKSLQLLVEDLRLSGHEVTVFATQASFKMSINTLENGAEIRRFRAPNLFWKWASGKKRSRILQMAWNLVEIMPSPASILLRRQLRLFGPDLVITSNISGWAYAPWRAARSLNLPLIHIVRDYGLICVRSNLLRDGKACSSVCAKCVPRSRATYRAWPGGVAVGVSASVLRNHTERGIFGDDERFVSHPRQAPGKRSKTRIPKGDVVFGFLGRMSPEKGIENLLEAGASVGATVRVAGGGPDGYVSELRRRYPTVKFDGYVDAPSFLAQVDVLVVPSLWDEPFGRVVGDAALAGVPCLISSRGGLIEAAHSSEALYREFDPASTQELARLMQSVMFGDLEWLRGRADLWPSMPIEEIVDIALGTDGAEPQHG